MGLRSKCNGLSSGCQCGLHANLSMPPWLPACLRACSALSDADPVANLGCGMCILKDSSGLVNEVQFNIRTDVMASFADDEAEAHKIIEVAE